MAFILAVLLGSVQAYAAGAEYTCVITEYGEVTKTIKFIRNKIVSTELTGYTIEFQDYLGRVTATVTEKSNGAKVAEEFTNAEMDIVNQESLEFEGLIVNIPDVLKITCLPSVDHP